MAVYSCNLRFSLSPGKPALARDRRPNFVDTAYNELLRQWQKAGSPA